MKKVVQIPFEQAKPWFIKKHYAKRIPSITYAFGLYVDGILKGVVSYGTPAASALLKGICGEEYSDIVIELNRLVLDEHSPKNSASFLVGRSLKLLPKPKIIVSYADTEHGHIGYVYQACNFIYTGLSAKRTDWKIKGQEHLHGQTIADKTRGQKDRAKKMREIYGDDFYLKERSRKHRYIYFLGCDLKDSLKYPILPYPKGETKRYDSGKELPKQLCISI